MYKENLVIFESVWLRMEGGYNHIRLTDNAEMTKKNKFYYTRFYSFTYRLIIVSYLHRARFVLCDLIKKALLFLRNRILTDYLGIEFYD